MLVSPSLGCPPKRDLTRPQVEKVKDLDELMWFLATVADPGFKLIDKDPAQLTEADFRRFADIGRRVPWAAERLKTPEFSKGPPFVQYASDLASSAATLDQAAAKRAGKQAQDATRQLKRACAGCHKKYR